jgi:nitroreductase
LIQKKVGLLSTVFPPDWRDPAKLEEVVRNSTPSSLNQTINGGSTLLIVMYDSRKRAPASEGDFLGIISLGCVMENMWLMAQSLGIGFHIISDFGEQPVEGETKKILKIPEYIKIAFGCRI